MRLDKFLSHTGFGSRKEVKAILKKGLITVAGEVAKDGKLAINEKTDVITVAGEVVVYEKEKYYLLNKPQGVISATEDRVHPTVVGLLSADDYQADIFPVGRLDKDTTGFLLLTNDGKLAHNLLSPKKHVPKTYVATVRGIVTAEDQLLFASGVTISGDETCLPATLTILSTDQEKEETAITVTISEGKYHQVKRMFEAVGKQVLTLHRESMGKLVLDPSLQPGEYRKLTVEELDYLKNNPQ